jgi:predicted DNA-binding ribbon-helix-helix protein
MATLAALKASKGKGIKSPIINRSIILDGHKTSISLEADFFDGLKEIAGIQNKRLAKLVTELDKERQIESLSSAVRPFGCLCWRITNLGRARNKARRSHCFMPIDVG